MGRITDALKKITADTGSRLERIQKKPEIQYIVKRAVDFKPARKWHDAIGAKMIASGLNVRNA